MKKLILIDGNAILHRAYHAMPGLTNKEGKPIGAVYGFFSMLLTILQEQKPDYLAICFDRSKPTIRQSMYAGYHEHRPPMDGDLVSQIIILDELLSMMNVQKYSLEGYEGDDVIGTFAAQAQMANGKSKMENTIETIIVTGDRDMLQLVNKRVKVLMTITGLTKTVLFDERMVEEKYGVQSSQFIDYKALIGDPSDGYPGITGIGPKTASSLLQKYGTFEALYEQISTLPEKVALKLATDAEQGALAKKLAAIITDAPIKLDLKACEVTRLTPDILREGFVGQGFKSLTKRLEDRYGLRAMPEVVKQPKEEEKDSEQLGLL